MLHIILTILNNFIAYMKAAMATQENNVGDIEGPWMLTTGPEQLMDVQRVQLFQSCLLFCILIYLEKIHFNSVNIIHISWSWKSLMDH